MIGKSLSLLELYIAFAVDYLLVKRNIKFLGSREFAQVLGGIVELADRLPQFGSFLNQVTNRQSLLKLSFGLANKLLEELL